MTKSKSTKKAAAKTRKSTAAATAAKTPDESKTKAPREELCVFAFRLTSEERDAIHKAAGPAKASRFARELLVAAARGDHDRLQQILEAVQGAAK